MACIFLYYEVDCIIVCVLPVWNLKKLCLHECRLARVKDIPGAIVSRVILALAKSSCALTRSVTKILDGALACISWCAGVNVSCACVFSCFFVHSVLLFLSLILTPMSLSLAVNSP